MLLVNCPLCQSNHAQPVAEIADYTVPSRNVICLSCGLVYTDPRQSDEELAAYYQQRFIQGRHQIASVEEARERARKKGSAKKYSIEGLRDGLSASSHVLEIGCSYGFLLNALRTATGCQVQGVEPSAVSAQFAEEEFKIPVFHGTVDAYLATPVDVRYDLIIIYHVLEHLTDSVGTLKKLKLRLKPEGRLYVCVPDVTHLQEPPESFFQIPHVISFSPWTLAKTLEAAGFKAVTVVRKLLPPKNGMEMFAVPSESSVPSIPLDDFPGRDPQAVARSIKRVRRFYGVLRGTKRAIVCVVPKQWIEGIAPKIGQRVRQVRDRFLS